MKNSVLTIVLLVFSLTYVVGQGEHEIVYKSSNGLRVTINENEHPVIYVDGEKFDFPLEILDQNKIESIKILKKGSPNGVLMITTKNQSTSPKKHQKGKPLIIIDGKKCSKQELYKIDKSDIKSITVLKDASAIEKYNAPNGAIIITTNKQK